MGKAAEKHTAQICPDSACHLFCPATTTVGIAHCRVTQYEECIGALQTGLPQAEREKDGKGRKKGRNQRPAESDEPGKSDSQPRFIQDQGKANASFLL